MTEECRGPEHCRGWTSCLVALRLWARFGGCVLLRCSDRIAWRTPHFLYARDWRPLIADARGWPAVRTWWQSYGRRSGYLIICHASQLGQLSIYFSAASEITDPQVIAIEPCSISPVHIHIPPPLFRGCMRHGDPCPLQPPSPKEPTMLTDYLIARAAERSSAAGVTAAILALPTLIASGSTDPSAWAQLLGGLAAVFVPTGGAAR